MKKIEDILLAADSPEMYRPNGFDERESMRRAEKLAKCISLATGFIVNIEDPSTFQDGPLFLALPMFSIENELPGEVLISRFYNLATLSESTDEVRGKISSCLEYLEYTFLPIDALDIKYSGKYERFNGLTWKDRFFSAFYDFDKFVGGS